MNKEYLVFTARVEENIFLIKSKKRGKRGEGSAVKISLKKTLTIALHFGKIWHDFIHLILIYGRRFCPRR